MISRYARILAVGIALAGLPLTAAHAQLGQSFTGSGTYTGNGNTGFGGSVGNGSLTLSYSNGTINGSFISGVGTGFTADNLVLYIGVDQTGIANTSTLTDSKDGGRTAISGFNGGTSSRTLVTFANGFRPTYALSIDPTFVGIFNLSNPADLGYLGSGGAAGNGTSGNPLTFSFSAAVLGLNPAVSNNIDFVGTLVSNTAYRSNETIGTSTTQAVEGVNAAFTGSQTFSTYNRLTTFATVVPEPGSIALIGIGALPLAGIVLRRRKAVK